MADRPAVNLEASSEDAWARAEDAWARAAHEAKALIQEMTGASPEDADVKHELAKSMRDPANVDEYKKGYEEGKRAGFDEAVGQWFKKLQYYFEVLGNELRSVLANELRSRPGSLTWFYKRLSSPGGTQILSELGRQLEAEAALWVQDLCNLKPTFDKLAKSNVFELAGLATADVARAMRNAGTEWKTRFYALTGKPREQGHHAGKLIGGAYAAVLIAAIEASTDKGVGRILDGTKAAGRIEELARDRFSPGRPRPPGLEDALDEVTRKLLKDEHALTPAVKTALDEASELATHIRRRSSRLMEELAELSLDDWTEILHRARSFKGKSDIHSVRTLKGYIAERLYKRLPQFAKLRDEIAKQLKGNGYWREEVVFEHVVATLAARKERLELQVTDGMLIAHAARAGGPRIYILAVFESKSPSVVRDLVKARKVKGEPSPWAGQFHRDYERLSELPIVINGETYKPEEVLISRRRSKWIAVTPKDNPLTRGQLGELEKQGFMVEQWTIPVPDRDLQRAADEVLKAVQHESR